MSFYCKCSCLKKKTIEPLFVFVSPHKGLLEYFPAHTGEIFSTCLVVLNNLCEIFGCSMIAHFLSAMCGFFCIVFSC